MRIKDLFAMCNREKLLACIAADSTEGAAEVSLRYLPVLEELSVITPSSDGQHFVLAMSVEDELKVMDFYRPRAEEWFRNMSAMRDMKEDDLIKSREVLDWAAQLTTPVGYSFIYTPWVEILDMEVLTDNLQEVVAEEMAAKILTEMTEAGFTAEAVDAQRQNLEKLLERTEYSSLNTALVHILLKVLSEEQVLEWKVKRAALNYRIYHLLQNTLFCESIPTDTRQRHSFTK
jgi:hypothetical protein